ncbi:MAG: Rrf2 family transcriptional regulator [Planctomycetes bacterium]|nr:Rrf2 family transcriptional regulator [Planctomycetota bacterium]
MFRITKKADYTVFVLAYLARRAAQEGQDVLVSAQELASLSSLNKSLIANLLKDLTRAGILKSVRGAHGGYRLARPATEIHFGEILEVVEGRFTFVECAHEHLITDALPDLDPKGPGGAVVRDHENCNLSPLCGSRGPLLVLHARIQRMMRDLSLAELSGVAHCATGLAVIRADDAAEVGTSARGESRR